MDAKTLLTLLGAGAEFLGISLVVLDARAARRAARDVLMAPVATAPRRQQAGRWVSSVSRPSVSYGAEWEAREFRNMVTRLIEGLGAQFQKLEDQLASEMEELADRIVDESAAREQQLRQALADDLVAGLGRRWLGAGLLVVGVGFSAAGNIVG